MAELRYVDWDGLVYYDGKIKSYITDKAEEYLKMGGILPFSKLPDPSWQNLNYIYKITEEFTSNNRFEKPGYVYKAGTWVQVVDFEETYKYAIFNEELIGNTSEIDLSNYYTKTEVDKKIDDALESIYSSEIDLTNYYTKDEVDALIPDDFATQSDVVILTEAVAGVQELLEEKADKDDLNGLATEEFVLTKIAEAELADKDVDLTQYYTKSEVDALIPEVPTKISELDNDIGFITEDELQEALSNIEHPTIDLTTYATKEDLANVVSTIPSVEGLATIDYVQDQISILDTSINNIQQTVTSVTEQVETIEQNYVQNSTLENYVTNEYIQQQNYITNQYIEQNYTTTEQLEATYVTNNTLNETVEHKVTEVIQEKVDTGEIEVKVNSIGYGEF